LQLAASYKQPAEIYGYPDRAEQDGGGNTHDHED
jgi:hypothetical protein